MYQLKREKNSPMPRGPRAQIGAKVKGRHKVDRSYAYLAIRSFIFPRPFILRGIIRVMRQHPGTQSQLLCIPEKSPHTIRMSDSRLSFVRKM